jgi:hypothetical protein
MTAREVLARVLAEGGQVIADPERPRIVVPPALESLVREHRGELRALIAANAAGAAHGSRETVDPEPANEANRPAPPVIGQRDTTGAYDACAACGVGTWIRFADIPLCRRCADARGALALAYWDVLGELDRLNAEGPYADSGACRSAVDHAARLTDDLGAELAIRLRGRWSRVTGRCPLCGGAAH